MASALALTERAGPLLRQDCGDAITSWSTFRPASHPSNRITRYSLTNPLSLSLGCYPPFTNEETESRRSTGTCLRSHSSKVSDVGPAWRPRAGAQSAEQGRGWEMKAWGLSCSYRSHHSSCNSYRTRWGCY